MFEFEHIKVNKYTILSERSQILSEQASASESEWVSYRKLVEKASFSHTSWLKQALPAKIQPWT